MRLDLAAQPGPAADEDFFRVSQKAESSYEVVVDSTSGDIGSPGFPLRLERVAPDGQTVLQSSIFVGKGFSRSLRWTTSNMQIDDEFIRVRSGTGSCETSCGADDVYRIRFYDTTYTVSRFDNTDGQATFLMLQNPTSDEFECTVFFYSQFGGDFGVTSELLSPKEAAVIDTREVAEFKSGSLRIRCDGRYGALVGKAVTVDPDGGFSHDTPLEPRPR